MKYHWTNFILLCGLAILVSACMPNGESKNGDSIYPSQFIAGDVYVLNSGERINGNIAGIGTTLILEKGSIVSGDISLIGSNLDLSGEVNGDINLFAGSSYIGDSAVIQGDINQTYHQIHISPNAIIRGRTNTFVFPSKPGSSSISNITNFLRWLNPSRILFLQIGRIIFWILISLLVIGLFPDPTGKVITALRNNPLPALGVGFISLMILPIVSIILIVTICLSPVGIILLIVLSVSYVWGWVSIGYLVGIQLTSWLNLDWKKEAIVLTGALALGTITMLLIFIPILGFITGLIISSIGIGAIIFSRFGTSGDSLIQPEKV